MFDGNAKYMIEQINKYLVGSTIDHAISSSETFGMDTDFGFMVRTKSGVRFQVWIQRDAEGNGPGWLAIEKEPE